MMPTGILSIHPDEFAILSVNGFAYAHVFSVVDFWDFTAALVA